MGEYSLEAIVALKPDLVLASELNSPELVAALEKLGLTVYYLPNPKSFEDLYTNLETVATLTGRDATKLTDSLKARVTAVDEKIAPLSYRPTVFYEMDATDPSKPYTAGRGHVHQSDHQPRGRSQFHRAGGHHRPVSAGQPRTVGDHAARHSSSSATRCGARLPRSSLDARAGMCLTAVIGRPRLPL